MIVRPDRLHSVVSKMFRSVGVPKADSDLVSDHLIEADLRGMATHGVVRVPSYVRKILAGEVAAEPEISVVSGAPGLFVIEGQRGLGVVVARKAYDHLLPAAQTLGISVGFLKNVGHLGAVGLITQPAVDSGMAALCWQHTPPSMALPGMTRPVIGNNPMALGFPTGDDRPINIDLACSVVARGNIVMAESEGIPIPLGWAMDKYGQPTEDPAEAMRGALEPMGGYKGLALAMMVDLLAGVVTGASESAVPLDGTSSVARSASSGVGAVIIVINVAATQSSSTLYEGVDRWRRHLHEVGGERVRIPGQRGAEERAQQLGKGVVVRPYTFQSLLTLADEAGLHTELEDAVLG